MLLLMLLPFGRPKFRLISFGTNTHVSFDDLLSASPTFPKPRRRLLNTPCQHSTAHAWSDSASRADLDLACATAAALVFWSARHSPGRWVLWCRLLGLRICTDSRVVWCVTIA